MSAINRRLMVALKVLLEDAERFHAGFPLTSEEWYATRDYARASLQGASLDDEFEAFVAAFDAWLGDAGAVLAMNEEGRRLLAARKAIPGAEARHA